MLDICIFACNLSFVSFKSSNSTHVVYAPFSVLYPRNMLLQTPLLSLVIYSFAESTKKTLHKPRYPLLSRQSNYLFLSYQSNHLRNLFFPHITYRNYYGLLEFHSSYIEVRSRAHVLQTNICTSIIDGHSRTPQPLRLTERRN